MVTQMPIQTNSCPCIGLMPTWVVWVGIVIIGCAVLIMIPVFINIICGIVEMWSDFLKDIAWKIEHRRDK